MRESILKIFILFIFSGYAIGQSEILTRSEKIEIFKAEQKCVADASEKEDWSVVTPCAKKSLAILEDLLGRDHKSVALITYEYGLSLGYAGNVEESSKVLQQAVKRYNSAYGKNSPELIPILIDFAVAANKLEDFENISPVTIYARAFQIYKESPNFTNLNYANMVADGVNEIIKKNNFIYKKYTRTTLRFAKEAIKIYQKLGLENMKTARLNFNVGKIELASNRKSSTKVAIEYLKEASKNKQIAPYAYAFLIQAYEDINQSELVTEYLYQIAEYWDTGSMDSSDFYPIFVKKAEYPKAAQKKGKEGYVILELTVSETGNPIDVIVLEEHPEKFGFGKAAKEAANGLRYIPRVINGKALQVQEVLYKYTFNMAK